MKKSQGAVTVFLIIVLFSTTLLGGLFIDATRILLAKRVVRNAADSAARSALAGYDEHIANEYGLFAVNKDSAEVDFKRYFKNNIYLSQNDGFDILSLDVKDENIKVTVSSPLNNHTVMLDQMMEYAKYRSLVDTTVGAIQKFSNVFGGGKATNVMDTTNSSRQLVDGLQSKAKNVSTDVRNIISDSLGSQAEAAKGNVVGNLTNANSPNYRGGSFSDAELGFDKMDGEINNARKKKAELEKQLADYNRDQAAKADALENMSFSNGQTVDEYGNEQTVNADNSVKLNEADQGIDNFPAKVRAEINDLNTQINAAENKLNGKKQQIRDQVGVVQQKNDSLAQAETELAAAQTQLTAVKQKLSVLEADPYADYAFELNGNATDEARQLQRQFEQEVAALQSLEDDPEHLAAQKELIKQTGEALTEEVKKINQGISNEDYKIKTAIAKTREEQKVVKSLVNTKKAEVKKLKAERDQAANQVKQLYDDCGYAKTNAGELNIPNEISKSKQEEFSNKLAGFIGQLIEAFNYAVQELQKTDVVGQTYGLGDVAGLIGLDTLAKDIWKTIGDFGKDIDGIIYIFTKFDELDDAFLFTSYMFSTHSYLTSQTDRSSHYFQVGEIEYILQYDNHNDNNSQAICVCSTVFDIAKLRLLINWLTYMIQSKIPEMIARIISTLAHALLQTLNDLVDMIFATDGKSAPGCALSPAFPKLKVSYSDHLRLKMMLRAINENERDKMFERMLTLMRDTTQYNKTWDSPDNLMCRLEADVSVDVDLVMLTLPMFEKILPADNQVLQDGKFLVHEKVSMGY